jgi:hypothetical protein
MNDPVEKSAQGNANTYALRKLRKDRPDLHERVLGDVPDWLELATRLIRPISDNMYSRKLVSTIPHKPTLEAFRERYSPHREHGSQHNILYARMDMHRRGC